MNNVGDAKGIHFLEILLTYILYNWEISPPRSPLSTLGPKNVPWCYDRVQAGAEEKPKLQKVARERVCVFKSLGTGSCSVKKEEREEKARDIYKIPS